jgi:metal-responsive CopG/Arc/MetJ family transcriptional regulator
LWEKHKRKLAFPAGLFDSPQGLIDEIEEWSKRNGATRSEAEAIRRLIEAGLSDNNTDGSP